MSLSAPARSDLTAVFNPVSIAVVGVSARESNLGLRFKRSLRRHGYAGELWAINRRAESVGDVPGFASAADLPGPIGLAIIAVNAAAVDSAVGDCAEAGARAALVFTSGYAEVGGEGVERQRRLVEVADAAGMRLLGPNCVGFANVADHVCPMASGFAFRPSLEAGELAVVTQSGGVAGLLAERALDLGIGLSHVVTTGNEGDVTAADVLQHLAAEGRTRQIALYLEAVRDPQGLANAFRAATDAGVQVAVFKAGSGRSTAAAASAHTGAVVGDDAGFDAFCRQSGVTRVHDLDHLFLAPPIASRVGGGIRIGVLSTSGGAAVAVSDACERAGLELPPLGERTTEAVAAVVPGFASTQNPIDISGTFVVAMEQFRDSLAVLEAADEFDAVLLVQTVHPPDLAERIADVVIEVGDPARMVVVWVAGSQSAAARVRLRRAGFAVTESANACALGLRAAGAPSRRHAIHLVDAVPVAGPPESASQTLARLAERGAPIAPMARARSDRDAMERATEIGFPVVLKLDSAVVAHKTEHGGVLVGLSDGNAVREGFTRLEATGYAPDGVLVQASVSGARELLVTARADPVFGLVLAVGFGGVMTEVVGRAAIVLPPVDAGALRDALDNAGLDSLLGPFRGEAAVDLDALAGIGRALIDVAAGLGGVQHLECNPVIVDRAGRPWVVDALVDRPAE